MLVQLTDVFWVVPSQVSAVYLSGEGNTVLLLNSGEAIPLSRENVLQDVITKLGGHDGSE